MFKLEPISFELIEKKNIKEDLASVYPIASLSWKSIFLSYANNIIMVQMYMTDA